MQFPTNSPNLLMMKKYITNGKLTNKHMKLAPILAESSPTLVD